MSDYILQLEDISKFFGPVIALGGVTLRLRRGEVHCLLGDNGAGKSTLIKTLAGVHSPDKGEYLIDGKPVRFASPRQALDAGVIISAGTDGFSAPDAAFPALYEELELLVNRAGFTPMQAIVAATRNGALSVRKDPDFGTIEAGKLANLVFTRQDPSKDIGALRTLTLTVKRGKAYPRTDYDPKADAAVRKED